MGHRVTAWFEAKIGLAGSSALELAVMRQRFIALKQQIPWLYGMLFACLLGIHLALERFIGVPEAPALIALTVIAMRLAFWRRVSREDPPDHEVRRHLRRAVFVSAAFCLGSLVWSISLYWSFSAHPRIIIATFASMVAIGCCYGMNSFPAAARIPVFVLSLPIAVTLTISSDLSHVGIGFTFIVLSLLTLRLLKEQDIQFRNLISSHFAIEVERRRAVEAEKIAVAEQVRVGIIAETDPLTGLANRRGFLKALDILVRSADRRLALILLDLDGFKPVNDTFGHAAGDAMLVEVSRRLMALHSTPACIARMGGDEFALLCECSDEETAGAIAREAVAALSLPFEIGGKNAVVSCCAGLSFHSTGQLGEAMRRADIALYAAKRTNRGSVAMFNAVMQEEVERRTALEQALRQPGLADDLDLAFQPILDLRTMELRSFEALARWRHSEFGWIPPSEFIPISEQLNVVHEISDALLKCAAAVACQWPESVMLSFNLSAIQLSSATTASNVLRIVAEQGLKPCRLQVEVTETALLSDFALARTNLAHLRQAGVRIVLDDFGAGYSSINYLREMNFDTVKLDGSLVTSVHRTKNGLALLRGVLALSRAMGQDCVAEHIETTAQRDLLISLGCQYGQGYLLSPPVDAATATGLAYRYARAVGSRSGSRSRHAPRSAA